MPEEEALDAAGLGAALVGVVSLFANWAPTALSKKPPPDEARGDAAGLGAALVGVVSLFANWAPTALSKKPPPDLPATNPLQQLSDRLK